MSWIERHRTPEGDERKETFKKVEAFDLDNNEDFKSPSLMAFYPHQVPPEKGGGNDNDPEELNSMVQFLSWLTLAEIIVYLIIPNLIPLGVILVTVGMALFLFFYKQ